MTPQADARAQLWGTNKAGRLTVSTAKLCRGAQNTSTTRRKPAFAMQHTRMNFASLEEVLMTHI
jgi:hypothetical protein